jgi:hypothetical protein
VTANNVVLGDETFGTESAVIRFENVTVPKGADITSAYIEFVPGLTESDPIQLTIYGQLSENAPMFSYGSSNMGESYMIYIKRVRTNASVPWDIEPWIGITIEKKIDIAKSVIGEMFTDTTVSWGFGSWVGTTPWNQAPDSTYTIIHEGCKPHSTEHLDKLQAALDALTTNSSTPFSPSIMAAEYYFEGLKKDDDTSVEGFHDGELFEESDCQPKFLIQVTDGQGNVDSTVENVISRTTELVNSGVSAIGVGFGLQESETAQLYAMAEVANNKGNEDPDDQIYAIHPENQSGDAEPFFAYSKEELINVFQQIANAVKGATYHGTAPAATTSSDLGDVVIVASFDAATWSGDVEAIQKDDAGNWTEITWSAADEMPTTRNIFTIDPSSDSTVIPYTDSVLETDVFSCFDSANKPIGDIVNSTPIVVGPPPFLYPFDDYFSFRRSADRDAMVYIGANDGSLHAIRLEDGVEQWAFIPKSMHDKLNLAGGDPLHDRCDFEYCHQNYIDGSPMFGDVYADFGSGPGWRTVLVVGEREGGTSYFALDVTSGKAFDAAEDPSKFLWEFTDDQLGETWADPCIERVTMNGGLGDDDDDDDDAM